MGRPDGRHPDGRAIETDVAIIGAGPVGLLLASLLGLRGHSVTVLEKQPSPYPMPRAIHFDGEAMRCFQTAGLAGAILPHTLVGKGMLFKDRHGDTIVDWSRGQTRGPMGWHESYRFFQPGLEAELRKGLERFGDARLMWGAEVTGISQDRDGVSLSLGSRRTVTARFAVACDGARSFTRRALNIGTEDLGFRERWLVCDLLLKRTREDLGDHSIQYCDPEAPATYVRGVGNWRRWEIRLGVDDPNDVSQERNVWEKLKRWITPSDATLERSTVYTFRSRIANAWRDGRILLAGDAAHQMPPFMGQGMCAGIRDAGNLWWKLSAVLCGGEDALLDTYQSEREANARAFIEKSVALGKLINQTAAGVVPRGRMESIWPDLGPGLGPRDGVGGALVPQVHTDDGILADDAAKHGFYVLAADNVPDSRLPAFVGANRWIKERNLTGIVVRPDGYALAGFRSESELMTLETMAMRIGMPEQR